MIVAFVAPHGANLMAFCAQGTRMVARFVHPVNVLLLKPDVLGVPRNVHSVRPVHPLKQYMLVIFKELGRVKEVRPVHPLKQ